VNKFETDIFFNFVFVNMEINGYENYLIYPDGKVWSKASKRYLSPSHNDGGYLYVVLYKDGIPKTHKIHRLLAEHYIPNPDNKPCVDHINRDKKDNSIENLRWATDSENGQNRGVSKNNKLGIKNICYNKSKDSYRYNKMIKGVIHHKSFKTLEEAISYRDSFNKDNENHHH
jgi:hypothetical protein